MRRVGWSDVDRGQYGEKKPRRLLINLKDGLAKSRQYACDEEIIYDRSDSRKFRLLSLAR